MKNKLLVTALSVFLFCIGLLGGAFGITYFTLPSTDKLLITDDVFYSISQEDGEVFVSDEIQSATPGNVSVHFLELGNKYTGDCTYIKVGSDIDILIDCGSKSNSIESVSSYINNFVTDGILEYVIITHAHQDHYAGFATENSIFDKFTVGTVIQFAKTNQNSEKGLYKQAINLLIKALSSVDENVSLRYEDLDEK